MNQAQSAEESPQEQLLTYLLKRIADQEEEAMSILYDTIKDRVFGIALRILQVREWAEDAMLDAFTKIWHQAHRFDANKGRAMVWMSALVRNCSLDHLRRHVRHQKNEEMAYSEEHIARVASVDHSLEQTEERHTVHKALEKLNEEQRRVVAAAYFLGMSHGEISKALGYPLGTVKTRIRTAMSILRQELSRG